MMKDVNFEALCIGTELFFFFAQSEMEIDLLAKPRNELPNKLHYMPS
jgi:hypothetical protein